MDLKHLILYLLLIPGIIFGFFSILLGLVLPIWLIFIISFGIGVMIVLIIERKSLNLSPLNLGGSQGIKQKISWKSVPWPIRWIIWIVIILLVVYAVGLNEQSKKTSMGIGIERFQIPSNEGLDIIYPSSADYLSIDASGVKTKDGFTEVHLNLPDFDKGTSGASFNVERGNWSIKSVLYKYYGEASPLRIEGPELTSDSGETFFTWEEKHSRGYQKYTMIIKIFVPDNELVTITNIIIEKD